MDKINENTIRYANKLRQQRHVLLVVTSKFSRLLIIHSHIENAFVQGFSKLRAGSKTSHLKTRQASKTWFKFETSEYPPGCELYNANFLHNMVALLILVGDWSRYEGQESARSSSSCKALVTRHITIDNDKWILFAPPHIADEERRGAGNLHWLLESCWTLCIAGVKPITTFVLHSCHRPSFRHTQLSQTPFQPYLNTMPSYEYNRQMRIFEFTRWRKSRELTTVRITRIYTASEG